MVIVVEKSLGRLREIYYENPALCSMKIEDLDFSAEKKYLKCWQDYGQYNENRILLKNKSTDDKIIVNGVEFHPIIKDIHYFQLSRDDADSHTITIEGRYRDGRLFEETLRYKTREILPHIIYAIIIISYSTDINEAITFWKLLTDYYPNPTNNLKVGETLDLLMKLQDFGKKIVKEYPFMESFIQDGLNQQKNEFQQRISDIDILREVLF